MTVRVVNTNYAIAFSAGVSFSRAVERITTEWGVTPSEACKRLSVLASLCFDLRHHDAIARLTPFSDDRQQPFASTCNRAATVIAAEEERIGKELTQKQKYRALIVLAEHNEREAEANIDRGSFEHDRVQQ